MPSGRNHHRPPRKPTFFWQGTLILLPAVLLSVTGLQSLRQDRALAEHQAIEQAKALAKTISERLSLGVLQPAPPPESSAFAQALGGRLDSEADPVMQTFRAGRGSLGFLLGTDGDLLYPSPWPGLPSPEPLDLSSLDEAQQAAWNEFEAALLGGQIASAHATSLDSLLATKPPPRFAALAQYRAGLACELARNDQSARELFSGLSDLGGAVHAENGFPLTLFARVHLLNTESAEPGAFRRKNLNELCGFAVAVPTSLTPRVLHWCETLDREIPRRWKEALIVHDRSRQAAARLAQRDRHELLDLDGQSYFLFSQPLGSERWIVALPQTLVKSDFAQLLKTLAVPEHFAVSLSLANVALYPERGRSQAEPLAANVSEIALDRSPAPLDIRISLADPEKFYAAQRSRTLRFALLIALSGAAVLIGFLTAWRAFLRQQALNEMKTNFVSSVTHELRAPIASVRLMAQELEADSEPDQLQSYLRFIVQECLRLSAVIENVLDFSRREQGRDHFDFESTDLVRLVRDTGALMQRYAEGKSVALEIEVRGEPYDVEADGAALQRLFVNLTDNAIKHSPENAVVRIGLDFAAERTLLWVEDRGPGIARDEQPRIFERFYRIGSELRRTTQGVGLGLSIVKYIAEEHGGAVRVRSELGQGSRFTLELPRVKPAPRPLS